MQPPRHGIDAGHAAPELHQRRDAHVIGKRAPERNALQDVVGVAVENFEKTGIGAYTEEDIIRSLKEMKKKDGSPIMPPMALYQSGWYRLEDGDARAIAAFFKSLKPIVNRVPKSTFKPAGPPPGAPPATP